MSEEMIETPISKGNLGRLEPFAKGFGKTPNDALTEVLRIAEAAMRKGFVDHVEPEFYEPELGPHGYDADAPPNLAHTTVLSASIDGEPMPRGQNYWNNIMHEAMRKAAANGKSPEEIFRHSTAHVSREDRSDNGFKFIPEAGLSVQGQDSNNAWKQIRQMAQLGGFQVAVEFRWQENPKAERPGETGSLLA